MFKKKIFNILVSILKPIFLKICKKYPSFEYDISVTLFLQNNLNPFIKNYGPFEELKDYDHFSFCLNNESQYFYGEIKKMILDIGDHKIKRVLLPGETNDNKEDIVNNILEKLGGKEIVTVGLGKNVDYVWDFEEVIPNNIGKYSLIISQAMIEHIVDPYKHIKDLSSMLETGGYLIVHSVMPGFMYHRYPTDNLRFFPDWFEEIGNKNRCKLKVVRKFIRDYHVFYMYKKV